MNEQGRDVVLEVVRQLCIHQAGPQYWWRYIRQFQKTCFQQTTNLTLCSQEQVDRMGIPDIEGCVSKSFDIQEKFNINNREHLGTIQSHTHIHSSTKQSPDVVNEIDQDGRCSSLKAPPQFCDDYETHGEMLFHLKLEASTSILKVVMVSSLILTIFFVFLFVFYRRWAKIRMQASMGNEVNQMVFGFVALFLGFQLYPICR